MGATWGTFCYHEGMVSKIPSTFLWRFMFGVLLLMTPWLIAHLSLVVSSRLLSFVFAMLSLSMMFCPLCCSFLALILMSLLMLVLRLRQSKLYAFVWSSWGVYPHWVDWTLSLMSLLSPWSSDEFTSLICHSSYLCSVTCLRYPSDSSSFWPCWLYPAGYRDKFLSWCDSPVLLWFRVAGLHPSLLAQSSPCRCFYDIAANLVYANAGWHEWQLTSHSDVPSLAIQAAKNVNMRTTMIY